MSSIPGSRMNMKGEGEGQGRGQVLPCLPVESGPFLLSRFYDSTSINTISPLFEMCMCWERGGGVRKNGVLCSYAITRQWCILKLISSLHQRASSKFHWKHCPHQKKKERKEKVALMSTTPVTFLHDGSSFSATSSNAHNGLASKVHLPSLPLELVYFFSVARSAFGQGSDGVVL